MTAQQEEYFLFGMTTGTHGLRGDLKVRPLTSDSTVLQDAERVFLRRADGVIEEHEALRVSPHKGSLLLRLKGFESLDAAEPLVGCEILMRFDELAELPEDEFYWFELQGITVVDKALGEIGTLEDLMTTAAGDIYVIRGPFGEVLIPAVDEFVKEIDTAGNRMTVTLPEGLVPEPE